MTDADLGGHGSCPNTVIQTLVASIRGPLIAVMLLFFVLQLVLRPGIAFF
jgi:hypothetical protein